MEKKTVSIIGTGALGTALTLALDDAKFPIASIFNRTENKAKSLADKLDVRLVASFPEKLSELGKIVFLTVPDQNIRNAAQELAGINNGFDEYTVVHCSGNKTSAEIDSLREKGASIASFHPLQTFTKSSKPSDFEDIYIDLEGDSEAVAMLKDVAGELKSHPMEISAEAKPYLHAAAVMASNYMVALTEAASQIAEMGGIKKSKARRALMPLMKQSLENISESADLPDALSGPIARGDTSTIAEHLKILEQNPQLSVLYQKLGAVLLEITKSDNRFPDEQLKEISRLLDNQ